MIDNRTLAFNMNEFPIFEVNTEKNYSILVQCLLDGFTYITHSGIGWKTITTKRKDCFRFYDDGDNECEACTDSNTCFRKGAI